MIFRPFSAGSLKQTEYARMPMQPKQDVATVTPEGRPISRQIEGVVIRYATTQIDDRGTLCEILNPAWGFHASPFSYVYQFSIRPGRSRDGIFIAFMMTAFFSARERPRSCCTMNARTRQRTAWSTKFIALNTIAQSW
jgi:hypothetical protein